jgi:hypothetical protein
LALGLEPLSWRLSGAVSGTALLFIIYTQLLFPGLHKPMPGTFWQGVDYQAYFCPPNPGDFFLKAPALMGAIFVPLFAWRVLQSRSPSVEEGKPLARQARWLQFHFQDCFVWMCALCVLLTAYLVPPHAGWADQVRVLWLRGMQLKTEYAWFAVLSGLPTACLLLAVLHSAAGSGLLVYRWRMSAVAGLTSALAFDVWWDRRIVVAALPSAFADRPAETAVAIVSAAVIFGSIWLFVEYDRTLPRQAYRPVRPGKVHARMCAGRSSFIRSRTARNRTPTARESVS